MTRHKQYMTGLEMATQLMKACDYFTGVPDGALKKILPHLDPYYPAPREDHAIAMAFGARLIGKKPCVLMQNSGVGYIGDVLLGLTTLYRTGVVIIVGCRGEFANEEPQHRAWGYERTRRLIRTYGVEACDIRDFAPDDLPEIITYNLNRSYPLALLIRRGVIDEN